MGINLALAILEGREKPGPHGGVDEACAELTRESFWMTDDELSRALSWAQRSGNGNAHMIIAVVASERDTRSRKSPVGHRQN
jgi:hypothetical protein